MLALSYDFTPLAHPIIKWAGGKRQLWPHLLASRPPRWHRYFEPFAGGAALFFAVAPHAAMRIRPLIITISVLSMQRLCMLRAEFSN